MNIKSKSNFNIITLSVGQLKANCYLISLFRRYGKSFIPTLIIDPGDDADMIIQTVQDYKLKPVAMIADSAQFSSIPYKVKN